ncbi:hypothetical protein [Prevotella sp. HUN102]|uniref:hypothetical protein n=1 Tax=Prevotella sp. HUN102 TaxID=1392486 RepID=UPI0012DCCB56|nr:hypothetical protein [Prevotella sp. HUN102]
MNKVLSRAFGKIMLAVLFLGISYSVEAKLPDGVIKFASSALLGGNLDEFPEGTTWYRINLDGYPLSAKYYVSITGGFGHAFSMDDDRYSQDDNDLWCVVEYQPGSGYYYLLNKKMGPKLFLTSYGTYQQVYPNMDKYDKNASCFYMDYFAPSDQDKQPTILIANYKNSSEFLGRMSYQSNATVKDFWLANTQHGITTGGGANAAYKDPKTHFHFFEVPVLTDKEKNQAEAYISSQKMVGGFPSENVKELEIAYKNYKDKPNNPETVEKLRIELKKLIEDKEHRIKFAPGYYRLRNADRRFNGKTGRVIYTDYEGKIKWGLSDSTKVDKFWEVKQVSGTSYTVQNPNTVTNITSATKGLQTSGNLTIEELSIDDYPGHFKLSGQGEVLHAAGHSTGEGKAGEVINYTYNSGDISFEYEKGGQKINIDQASVWYLEPITFINIPVKKRYSTFYFPFAVEVKLSGKLTQNGFYIYKPVKEYPYLVKVQAVPRESVLPAKVPAIFESEEVYQSGEAKTFSLPIKFGYTETMESIDGGIWQGTLVPSQQPEGIYIMKTGSQGSAFYRTTMAGKVPANKVFLKNTAAAAGAKDYLSFSVEDRNTTGIQSIGELSVAEEVGGQKYYDLTGRRVMNPRKGIYINAQGKKIIFK